MGKGFFPLKDSGKMTGRTCYFVPPKLCIGHSY